MHPGARVVGRAGKGRVLSSYEAVLRTLPQSFLANA